MDYKLLENEYSTSTLTDRKNQKWPYISNKIMEELYPNGGYIIIADFKKGKQEDGIGCLIDMGQKAELFQYVPQLKKSEKCVGFIYVEGEDSRDTFVRIVKKTKKGLLLFLLLLSLCITLIGGWLVFNGKDRIPDLDESAISYHIEGLENKDPNNISIPLFAQIKIDGATMEGEVHMANPKGNPCYFEYRIVLQDGNEEVYRSKLIEPGTAVPKFKLKEKLGAGTYPAKILIHTYALDDYTVAMNGGEIEVELVVEEEN